MQVEKGCGKAKEFNNDRLANIVQNTNSVKVIGSINILNIQYVNTLKYTG